MAKLGTKKNPARVRVATEQHARQVLFVCAAKGWEVIAEINPDEPEDITDMKRLLEPSDAQPATQAPTAPPTHVYRNEPCPCGSGRKYKNCCGKE